MAESQLNEYISRAKQAGMSMQMIRENLIAVGWKTDDVDAALFPISVPLPPYTTNFGSKPGAPSVALNTNTFNTSMWDSFEHILLFISLGTVAYSFVSVISFIIDRYVFPSIDELTRATYTYDYMDTFIRSTLAALIVAYPLFVWFFLDITKRTLKNPSIRFLKARRFLIYLTLIATFIIVIGEITSVVYSFLNGNITSNFVANVCVIIVVSSLIFCYYFQQIKEDRKIHA